MADTLFRRCLSFQCDARCLSVRQTTEQALLVCRVEKHKIMFMHCTEWKHSTQKGHPRFRLVYLAHSNVVHNFLNRVRRPARSTSWMCLFPMTTGVAINLMPFCKTDDWSCALDMLCWTAQDHIYAFQWMEMRYSMWCSYIVIDSRTPCSKPFARSFLVSLH